MSNIFDRVANTPLVLYNNILLSSENFQENGRTLITIGILFNKATGQRHAFMHLYQKLFHPGGGLPIISRILQISFPAENQGTAFSYDKMFSLY